MRLVGLEAAGLKLLSMPKRESFAMSGQRKANAKGKDVAVVIGATSKWQSDGRMTALAHGHAVDDSNVPVGVRWGVGGAIAQKFADEGFFTVLTTRTEANAAPLADVLKTMRERAAKFNVDKVKQQDLAGAGGAPDESD